MQQSRGKDLDLLFTTLRTASRNVVALRMQRCCQRIVVFLEFHVSRSADAPETLAFFNAKLKEGHWTRGFGTEVS